MLPCWSWPAPTQTPFRSRLFHSSLRDACAVLPPRSADLLELASPGSVDSRLRVAQRMQRSYTVFQARM